MLLFFYIIVDITLFWGAWVSYAHYKPYPYIPQGVFIGWFLFWGLAALALIVTSWEYI